MRGARHRRRGARSLTAGEGIVMVDGARMRVLTIAEVAEVMRVSKMTVYRLVHSGELPAIRFGKSFRVPEWAMDAAIATAAPRGEADAG